MSTIFSQIIEGKLPSKKVFENERILAIEDIHPVAPVHILIMPKKEIKDIQSVTSEVDAEPRDLEATQVEGDMACQKVDGRDVRGFRREVEVARQAVAPPCGPVDRDREPSRVPGEAAGVHRAGLVDLQHSINGVGRDGERERE